MTASDHLNRLTGYPQEIAGGAAARWRRRWRSVLAQVSEWRLRARSRHELRQLVDREAWDLGLSPADALKEADKPFWKK